MIFNTSISTKILIFFFCIAITFPIGMQAQIKGVVIEKDSNLPIAFASITYQKNSIQKGVISDIYGKFVIEESNISEIIFSCVGYKQNKVLISSVSDLDHLIAELEIYSQELNEVIVRPANNPAIRIIKKVLTNKDKNNFQNYEQFSYRNYVKTVIDIKLSNEANARDSSFINNNESVKKQAVFISEYVISCLKSDNWTENKIIAHKTSGFEDPMIAQTFTSTFQNSISFYDNSISLFELPISSDKSISEYVSPLSDGCLNIYNYQLNNTIINTMDSVFIINFYPKKGRNFNSLKGKLYISTNGYAIKNIVVEPTEKGLIDFKFRQDYEFINNKWFPITLDEEISIVNKKIRGDINAYPVYLITSKIDSINYNPNTIEGNRKLEKVYVDLNSIESSDSIINAIRPDSLTIREKNTLHFMDSLSREHNFDYWIKLFPKFANGKIPVSYFDVNLSQIIGNNKYEGTRLGVGLMTNEKLSTYLSFGGFSRYGFKDKKWKYGSQIIFDINKYNEVQLRLSYQNNLKEAGFDLIDGNSTLSYSDYLRSNMGYRFDDYIERKVSFSFRTFRFLKITTSLSLNDIKPTYSYLFKGFTLANYQTNEFQFNAKYAYGQDLATWGNQRAVNHEGNPIINFTYKRGLNLFNKTDFKYNKIDVSIDYTVYNGRIGQSNFRLATGFVDQSLPYGLLFTGEGSKDNDLSLLANNNFQAMSPYEFLSDKYVNLFYSHNFGSLLFTTKKFKPHFVIVQNSGWGSLENASYQGIDFKQKDKIYLESGLIINNLIKLNYVNMFYLGLGVGGFYRYGYYGYDNFKDNFALKLSVSLSLK